MIAQVSALQIFILIGAAQGFILAINIFLYRRKNLVNLFLAIGIFILSFRLLIYPFKNSFEGTNWAYVQNLSLITLLLVGPLLFIFIQKKLSGSEKFKPFLLLHFIPFLVYFTHLVYPYFLLPACYSYATLYSGIFYGGLAIWMINGAKIKALLKETKYQLNTFAFPLFMIPSTILGLSYMEKPLLGLHPATFPYLILTFLFYRISFKTLKGSGKFFHELIPPPSTSLEINKTHLARLIQIVEKEQLYLDDKISVVDLVYRTGLNRHEISQLIKIGLGSNFHDFINGYRIDHFKARLLDPTSKHLSIAGIAQESGFRSKSTFHHVFKEMTGLTPGKYQKSIKESEMA